MKQIEQSNFISFYIVLIMLPHFETNCYITEVLRSINGLIHQWINSSMDFQLIWNTCFHTMQSKFLLIPRNNPILWHKKSLKQCPSHTMFKVMQLSSRNAALVTLVVHQVILGTHCSATQLLLHKTDSPFDSYREENSLLS